MVTAGAVKGDKGLWGRGFSAVEQWFGDVWCGVLIAFMTLFMCTEIFARLIFNYSFIGIVDIVSLCLVMITYACLAAVERDDSHIKMDLIPERLSGKVSGAVLESINMVLGMIAVGFLLYAVTITVISLQRVGGVTMTIYWPYWPAGLFMPIGCLLYIVRMGVNLRKALSKIKQLKQA